MTAEIEILALLENDPTLTAINGKNVYYQEAQQKVMDTYIVFNTNDTPIRTKNGILGWDKTALIVCYAKSNLNATAMQSAVVNALENYSSQLIQEIEVTELSQSKNQESNIYQREIVAIIEV